MFPSHDPVVEENLNEYKEKKYSDYGPNTHLRYIPKRNKYINNGNMYYEMHIQVDPDFQGQGVAGKIIMDFASNSKYPLYFGKARIINRNLFKVLDRLMEKYPNKVKYQEGWGWIIGQEDDLNEEWSKSERDKRKSKCSNPKGFTMKQFCKNQKTRSKKGEKKNEGRGDPKELRKDISDYLNTGPQKDGSPYKNVKKHLKGKKKKSDISAPPGAPGGGSIGHGALEESD